MVFDGAHIGAETEVDGCVIGAGARIGAGVALRGAVIGDGVVLGDECELLDGARVWPGVEIPAGGVRFSADRR